MHTIKKILTAAVLLSLVNAAGCEAAAYGNINADNIALSAQSLLGSSGSSSVADGYSPDVLFKADNSTNTPLVTNLFLADPTSVEYNGRLYVYGTSDEQQYREKGDSSNTYERIKSFIIISTDDMVNWRYEGTIDTASIAPWIYASWAPSVVSRVEDDGITHFYLYFSNSGAGVGVLTATDPVGPWLDPLGKPLISAGMTGLEDCPNPFDPGAVIDENGTGWLAFGGGSASDGTSYMPGSMRICKLGKDMLSIDSEFAKIPAPYSFEASELNYIGGTYVYTYCSSWDARTKWNNAEKKSIPGACSMCYMTSKTPLDPNSWEYCGDYLKNPGELGLEYSNNHTHLQKYKGTYYLFFHTLTLQKERGIDKGFRSICAAVADVDEKNVKISRCNANINSVEQIGYFDPYNVCPAETSYFSDCGYSSYDNGICAKCSGNNVIALKGVDFAKGSSAFAAAVKGSGSIEIRLDSFNNKAVGSISFDCSDWKAIYDNIKIKGVHDVYFVMSGEFDFDEWQFIEQK